MHPSGNDLALGYANGGAQTSLDTNLGKLSPYVSAVSSNPISQQQVTKPVANARQNALSTFTNYLGGIFHQTGNIAGAAAHYLLKTAVEAPVELGAALGHGYLDHLSLNSIAAQNSTINSRMNTAMADYKAGRITKSSYIAALKGISQDTDNLVKQSTVLTNKVTLDKNTATTALINTAADIITIATAGFGKAVATGVNINGARLTLTPLEAKTAGEWMASKTATSILDPVANSVSNLATNSRLFQPLDSAMQRTLQKATAEVIANAGERMTAGQIAQATAANIALKYPMTFSLLSSQANEVYHELDQQKYGDAVRTLAFTSALLLSGGPIGQALKYGGKALGGLTDRTFGRTSFWDEMGKLHGDDRAYVQAIQSEVEKLPQSERAAYIKNLATAEAINVGAMGGDAAAAAYRVVKGMKGAYAIDMTQGDPVDHINQMVRLAESHRIAQQAADKLGLGNVAVGIWDNPTRGEIIDNVTQGTTTQQRLADWETMKTNNPNQAYANNQTVDTIVKNAITKSKDDTELSQMIQRSNATKQIQGFPQDVLDKLAKNGHIPIIPKKLEARFVEGGSKIVTNHAVDSPFFTRAVQPVPILSSVGTLFTKMGLSPQASQNLTYEMYNDTLARNLSDTRFVKAEEIRLREHTGEPAPVAPVNSLTTGYSKDELAMLKKQGITPETHPDVFKKGRLEGGDETPAPIGAVPVTKVPESQVSATDLILKRLSSYAHDDTRIPVKDLRALTVKQIREALNTDWASAAEIQRAISTAHMQVPLAVRGLGDRAVDWTYNLPVSAPVVRQYLKIQGALRFSFNPFFQYLRVIPKTEILSQAEGRGYIGSIFAGRSGEINNIRQYMRANKFLDKEGGIGKSLVGEAEGAAGTVGANINKKLLPMQERSIAGLIDAQAQRMNMDWKTYMETYPNQARDTIQMIAEYDRNANFLNSPMARTLNVAFFPFRFDLKVATIFARNLSKSNLLTQVAVINGVMKGHQFLTSPEGMAWYSQNSTIIGLMSYITPLASMAEVFNSLLPGHDHHLGNFGELGGLPFGWIPQLLDAEGLTHFNQPSMDPKTGEMFPSYIPVTARGQLAVAIQDLLGSLFSYPGAEIGLPSKTSLTRGFAIDATGANKKTDMSLNTPSPNPQQEAYQRALQANNVNPNSPVNQALSPTTPPQDTIIDQNSNTYAQPRYKSGSQTTRRKKKSEYTPALLPGQTSLGQLP